MDAQQDKKISISRRVMNAIKLEKGKGLSLVNLKKYLREEKNLDVVKYNEEIKLALKLGLDRGMLIRENGIYKVKEAKRGRDRDSKTLHGRSKSSPKNAEREKAKRKRSLSQASRKKTPVK